MKHTIELSGHETIRKGTRDKSWEAQCIIDLNALSTGIVRDLALHGLSQKIADAASQAKTEAEAIASMEKARDALLAGEWTARPRAGVIRGEAIHNLFAALLDKAQTKAFREKAWSERVNLAMANAEANPDHFTEERVADEIARITARREELRKAKAEAEAMRQELAGKVTIKL